MMEMTWIDKFKQFVEQKPIVVLRFDSDDWQSLLESSRGVRAFTIARSHTLFHGIKVPAPCLFQGLDEDGKPHLYFGVIGSKGPVSTLESRVGIRRVSQIRPNSETELCRLVKEEPHGKNVKDKLRNRVAVVSLSPKLSSHLVERLVSIP